MDHKLYIVDDDDLMRAALRRQLRRIGYHVEDHSSAEAFLAAYDSGRGVLLLDLKLPGVNGLALQQALVARGARLPVIVITGAADVASAVASMRLGAVDVLEKPLDAALLAGCIELAIRRDRAQRERETQRHAAERRLAGLTAAERRILGLLSAGHSTKAIAIRLDLSVRTVETHRRNIKRKAQAKSLPELIGLGMRGLPCPGEAETP